LIVLMILRANHGMGSIVHLSYIQTEFCFLVYDIYYGGLVDRIGLYEHYSCITEVGKRDNPHIMFLLFSIPVDEIVRTWWVN
jgi:hypothetical protein